MDPVTRLRNLEERLAVRGEEPDTVLALARTWRRLNSPRRAAGFAERAVKLDPQSAAAWNTLGAVLMDLRRWAGAEAAFARALKLDPGLAHAEDNLALALQQLAWAVQKAAQAGDWAPFDEYGERLLKLHRARMKQQGKGVVAPFSVLGFNLPPDEQRAAAEAQARAFVDKLDLAPRPSRERAATKSRRIRVGYLSADFRNNAAGHLLHGLFSCHDRDRFEVFGLSYGPEDGSEFRREIRAGVEHFVELRELDDPAAAIRLESLGLDLIIDLMGFAGNHRAGVLARRPAPVQALWLGYCMTTGAPWIDYFIADETALPPELEPAFSENVLRLPHSYQVYTGQGLDRRGGSRTEHGLPEDGMVYCSFNMPEKIDPTVWAHWMNILHNVPGSVLWLLCGETRWSDNYRARAHGCGIDPDRIVAAPLLPKRQHLERLGCADLFLDTTLCNAHTTAGDALWAGVPVLTSPGALFAQRVAASVCRAAGLPDLVVDSMEAYVATAIELGRDRSRIAELKAKLDRARPDAPLFDVGAFAVHLESLFDSMVTRAARQEADARRGVESAKKDNTG